MSTSQQTATPAIRYRFGLRACIVQGSLAALAIASAPSCGDGRRLDGSSPARADDVGAQASALTAISKLPCVGPDCPPPPPMSDGGINVDPGTDCTQLCIDQFSDAYGACTANCAYAYSSAGQKTQYSSCVSACSAKFRAGIARACASWRYCDGQCIDSSTDTIAAPAATRARLKTFVLRVAANVLGT